MDTPEKIKVKYCMEYDEENDFWSFKWLMKIWDSEEFEWLPPIYDVNKSAFATSKNWGNNLLYRDKKDWPIYHPTWMFETLRAWLVNIIDGDAWYYYYFDHYNVFNEISLDYYKISDEIGTFDANYDCKRYNWPTIPVVERSENVISQLDLIRNVYIWFIDYIIDEFDYKKWFEQYWSLKSMEPIYDTFFSCIIDKYLKNNWVTDIDEKVRKAKDKIKQERIKMYDENDKKYEDNESWSIRELESEYGEIRLE